MKPNHLQKSWFLLTCLLFISLTCFADTFIVTSNADSGPGTLREAITLANANGTSVTDYIHFNFADQSSAGRTITINSSLPDLSSNLIIDGSTQSGSRFGVSDAKVSILVTIIPNPSFSVFNLIGVKDIEIYGLFLVHDKFTLFSITPTGITGVTIAECSDITIGKPGKGNYFRGLRTGIYSRNKEVNTYNTDKIHCTNLTIQSNIFNNDEDGYATITYNNSIGFINPMDYGLNVFNITNLKIGGVSTAEGNTFNCYEIHIRTFRQTGNGFFLFQNNKMGTDVWGNFTKPEASSRGKLLIYGSGTNSHSDYEVKIIKNTIKDKIELLHISGFITIQGNTIAEVNGSGTSYFMDLKAGIYSCSGGGIIGGELPEEKNEVYTTNLFQWHYPWDNLERGGIVVAGSPNILIKKNKTYCTSIYGTGIKVYSSDQPYIQIDSTAVNFVKGKATPNTKIEVFLDDDCSACDGIALLGETTANADSTWSFNGNFTGTVIATATKNGKSTSGYTEPTYLLNNLKVQPPTCGEKNGSITGIKLLTSVDNVEWHQRFFQNNIYVDTVVSRELDLKNVGPGDYYFVAKLGATCNSAAYFYQLKNITPTLDVTNLNITNPSCGLFNGGINGIKLIQGNSSKYFWVNESRIQYPAQLWGSDMIYADKLPPGRYKLIVIDSIGSCGDSTNWITLTNQSGPTLNLNSLQITNASCGNNNGSITGISSGGNVAGMPYIAWVDSLNRVVANTYDINNLKAGKYRFKFKDQGGCDTIITPFYTINSTGIINIDISQLSITPSQCNTATGAIKNIIVTGASSYQWHNSAGQVISNTADPGTLLPGKYVLKVSNAGCTKQTDSIAVPVNPLMQLNYPLQTNGIPGKCDAFNGSLEVINFQNSQDFTFRWVDSMQPSNTLSTSLQLTGIRSGTYLLYAKNKAGCEQQVGKYTLRYLPPPQLNEASVKITNEICDNAGGAIEGIVNVTDKGIAPFSFTWLNNANATIASSQNLSGVSAGNYRLLITDRLGCTDTSSFFTIQNNNINLNKPVYSNQMIRSNNSVTLTPQNTQLGTYKLYNDLLSTTPVSENNNGIFSTGILTSTTTYYIEIVNGSCKSERVAVTINVYDKTIVYVPTAFSPNKDGLNDKINPIALGPVKLTYFKIYNRWGQQVFETSELQKAWDGLFKGEPQPSSNYQWILLAKDEMSGEVIKMSGSFLLIR